MVSNPINYTKNDYKMQQWLPTALAAGMLLGLGRLFPVAKVPVNANLMGMFAGMSTMVAINTYKTQNPQDPAWKKGGKVLIASSLALLIAGSQFKAVRKNLPAFAQINNPLKNLIVATVFSAAGGAVINALTLTLIKNYKENQRIADLTKLDDFSKVSFENLKKVAKYLGITKAQIEVIDVSKDEGKTLVAKYSAILNAWYAKTDSTDSLYRELATALNAKVDKEANLNNDLKVQIHPDIATLASQSNAFNSLELKILREIAKHLKLGVDFFKNLKADEKANQDKLNAKSQIRALLDAMRGKVDHAKGPKSEDAAWFNPLVTAYNAKIDEMKLGGVQPIALIDTFDAETASKEPTKFKNLSFEQLSKILTHFGVGATEIAGYDKNATEKALASTGALKLLIEALSAKASSAGQKTTVNALIGAANAKGKEHLGDAWKDIAKL